jgi:hypothetical protein
MRSCKKGVSAEWIGIPIVTYSLSTDADVCAHVCQLVDKLIHGLALQGGRRLSALDQLCQDSITLFLNGSVGIFNQVSGRSGVEQGYRGRGGKVGNEDDQEVEHGMRDGREGGILLL